MSCALLALGCTEIQFAGRSGGAGGDGSTGSTGGAELGGAGGAAGGGAASGGSPAMSEVCGNGVDDDLDMLTDCEDPECSDICNTLPLGWTGFVSVRDAGCGPNETLAQTAYLSASGSSECACSCGGPTCGTVVATAFGNSNCGGVTLMETLDGGCDSVGNSGSEALSVTATNSCGAPGANLVDPGVVSSSVDLCVDDEGTCIFHPGADLPCPLGFPVSSQYHGTYNDTRSCETGSCTCSSPMCGSVSLFSLKGCQGAVTPLPLNTCVANAGPARLTFIAAANQTCTVGGSSSTPGGVSLEAPLTVCCK